MSSIAPFQLTAGGMNSAKLKVSKEDAKRAYESIEEFNNMEEEQRMCLLGVKNYRITRVGFKITGNKQ